MRDFGGRIDERIAVLRSMRLFSGCNKEQLRHIRSLTTMMRMPRGTVLIAEDTPGQEFFIVVEGTATASRHGWWLADFGPGSFFGELALLDHGQRTATVVAATEMCVLVISRVEFWSLQGSAPSFAHKLLVELGVRLRRTDDLLDEESASAWSLRPLAAIGATGC
jgi:CRP-like cAMP-binding protein